MPAQEFFHQTSHANYGAFVDGSEHRYLNQTIKPIAKKMDDAEKSIYRIIFQNTNNGVQLFLAPYIPYAEIAEKMLGFWSEVGKIAYISKSGRQTTIKCEEFQKKFISLTQKHGTGRLAIAPTITLIKAYFESKTAAIEKKLLKIAVKNKLSTVKSQEYYSGLASTWLEPLDAEKKAA